MYSPLISSAVHYKLFNNDIPHTSQESGIGATIGYFNCCDPPCADDVAVLGGRIHVFVPLRLNPRGIPNAFKSGLVE